MAVFDKKVSKKINLDDTEVLTITIENPQNVNGHTEYVIRVQRGPNPEKSWLVCKRYSDFLALHSLIQVSGSSLSLPPKKLIGNMDRSFVAQRQLELQNYLVGVLSNPILATNHNVKKFLDPHNYAASLQELALQHVCMALRSEVNLELIKSIPDIGWRLRKHYFLVKSKLKPKAEMLLQWTEFGPDKYMEDKDLQNLLKCLVNLNHPHIEKLEYNHVGDGGCYTVRQLYQCGSLKDLIYNTKPKLQYLKKYGNSKQAKPLNVHEISLYGRQILETLLFLHEKGFSFGHLHLGNILVLDNNIKLIDIENSIFGLPSFYRPFYVQHKKISSLKAIDVYSFGHTLFEMTFGYPLNEPVCDCLPTSCPSSLGEILESILSSRSCKVGMPSVNDLLQHPFFSTSYSNQSLKISFKLTTHLKQVLKSAYENTEKRLQEEQKVIRRYKKLYKMQELLSSENELTKQKQRLKEDRSPNSKQLKMSNANTEVRKSPPRSDSLTSNSTAASAGAMTPPLQAPRTQTSPVHMSSASVDGRSALLDSICAFDKSVLRHRPTEVNGSAGS